MGESRSVSQSTITPLEYLNQLCEYALSIGMSYDLYWYGDADELLRFTRAEELRQKRVNYQAWLTGLYVYEAIGSLVPILNPFSKEHKARPYLKEPFPTSAEEVEERRLRKIEKWTQMMMSKVKKE